MVLSSMATGRALVASRTGGDPSKWIVITDFSAEDIALIKSKLAPDAKLFLTSCNKACAQAFDDWADKLGIPVVGSDELVSGITPDDGGAWWIVYPKNWKK